jgi:CheY-like chemotaxis protein
MFRATVKRHLERLGYRVIENDSGVGVKQQIHQEQPAACLIDIVMDKQEGLQTILEISMLPNRPKVIAVSSNIKYLDFAMSLGSDAQLIKPVTPETLANALHNLLS